MNCRLSHKLASGRHAEHKAAFWIWPDAPRCSQRRENSREALGLDIPGVNPFTATHTIEFYIPILWYFHFVLTREPSADLLVAEVRESLD